jgi:hypothetical protein
MAVKAVNDTAGFNGLIPTLLIFKAFLRIFHDSPPSPSIIKRAKAINQATKKLRKHITARQMNAALNICNGPNPAAYSLMNLSLQNEVRVWRENEGWQSSFRVIAHNGQNVTLELFNGPAIFRFTIIVPYYRSFDQDISDAFNDYTSVKNANPSSIVVRPSPVPKAPARRKKGRPKGSRNRSSAAHQVAIAHLSAKKVSDHKLAIKLRKNGVIITPGLPFEKSNNIKVTDLIARDIIAFKRYNPQKYRKSVFLFNSRIMHKIKDRNSKFHEKFHWMI